jgi:cellulose synthase/poly-beta-1,6-N-acetylglucosamine synthase-like glycosyltransferase
VRALVWIPSALLVWGQLGYGLFLAALRRARGDRPRKPAWVPEGTPHVSLIVAAYREAAVIEAKVRNALALDWPRDKLEVIVAVDGGAEPGADETGALARAAGAHQVLELPRWPRPKAHCWRSRTPTRAGSPAR